VAWSVAAQQQLAAIWMAASNRNTVTAASHAIDLALASSPHTAGVLVFDTVYEYTQQPLSVEYEVIDADMRVFVLAVWDTATGRPNPTGN
jgi:hypothetical protein